jgi:hypothetical protein
MRLLFISKSEIVNIPRFISYMIFKYKTKNNFSDPEIWGLICFRSEYELLLPII